MNDLSERVVSRYRNAMATKTRYIGTCAFCWQNVRCPDGKLAHHGYKRPGFGYIHGSCQGTSEEPWEVSPVTGQLALTFFTRLAASLERELTELPNQTQLMQLWGRSPKPLLKSEAKPYEWDDLYKTIERRLQTGLKNAVTQRDDYTQKLRDWKAVPVTTIEEEERLKQDRAEGVRKVRHDRYVVNRDKTVAHLRKAFARVLQGETLLKATKDPTKLAKALAETAKAARTIYETYASKPGKLIQNFPGPVDVDFIIADWGLDEMLQHMGLIQGGEYRSTRDARKIEMDLHGTEPSYYLWQGLDYWKPFWPGWTGTIEYPEGTTGRNQDRRTW